MTTLLADGDHFLFQACAACEREVRWDDQNHVLFSNREEAFTVFEAMLGRVIDKLKGDKVYLAFTGANNFRVPLSGGTYKAGRPRKPLCYWDLYQQISEKYTTRRYDVLEADDVMGIWQTSGKFKDSIIVSDDKDMKTIPGKLYRLGELATISVGEAERNWMLQTLTGDTTDGYSGCPGIGAVTAAKVLDNNDGIPWWDAVVQTYEKKGLTAEDALLQARLARILRAEDWDSEQQEVRLWAP